MNVFCVASGITGFKTVSVSDVERMKALREVVWVSSGTFGYSGTVRGPAACR
jgi:hypothetical protein